jgi:hypothetical protein
VSAKTMLISTNDNGSELKVIFEKNELQKFRTNRKIFVKIKVGSCEFKQCEKANWGFINILIQMSLSRAAYHRYVESKIRVI